MDAFLSETDEAQINGAIGAVGGTLEAEAKLIAQMGRAAAPVPQKLMDHIDHYFPQPLLLCIRPIFLAIRINSALPLK